jgi:aspartyl-tRNA(Asn)/glutamyl-tRNA(Gln) amidotransferase subunit A
VDYRMGLEHGVRDLRIAFSPDLGYARVDPEVAAIVRQALGVFSDLGAKVEEKHPGFEDPEPIFRAHWYAGAAFLLKDFSPEKKKPVDPGLVELAALGQNVGTTQLLEAQMKRAALGAHMNLFHREYDLLVTPALAIPAFDAGRECPDGFARWTDWTPFTFPFNLTQQPAASINCGFTKAGLPVGLQIVGPRHADALVLRAARAFETLLPIVLPH